MQYSIKNNTVLLIFILFGLHLLAQNNPLSVLNTSNGLPNNQIECIYKDSRGIVWVGTHNGLAKIEGGIITSFTTDDGLSNNSVWDIVEDKDGNLWFGTFGGGIFKFDGKNFTIQNHHEALNSSFVRKLFIHNNHLLIGTEKGLFIMDFSDNSIIALKTEQERFQVMGYFTDKGNVYVAAYRDGIFKLDYLNQKLIKSIDNIHKVNIFSVKNFGETIYYCSNGTVGGKSIFRFNTSNLIEGKAPIASYGNSIIWDVVKSKNGNIYAAGWGVLVHDGGLFEVFEDSIVNVSKKYGIESNQIRTLEYDSKYHLLYVGSQDKGVYKINLNEDIKHSYASRNIIGMGSLNYNLFTLHSDGLNIEFQNGNKQNIDDYKFINYHSKKTSELPRGKAFYNTHIRNLTKDRNLIFRQLINRHGFIWISTNIGLFQINENGEIINVYHLYGNIFEFTNKNDILKAPIYESVGLYPKIYNNPTPFNQQDTIYSFKGFLHSKPNNPNYVTAMIRDGDKIYCSSSKKGLFVFENNKFKSLAFNKVFRPKDINLLSINRDKRELIASTLSGNVYIIDLENDYKISRKISKEEIKGNNILALENYKNYVLVTTNKGLNLIDDNNNSRLIDEEQGLLNLNFTSSKIINETLYLGTSSGYYSLNLSHIENKFEYSPSVDISNIKINHEVDTTLVTTWFKNKENTLTYNHNQNTVEIDFKVSNHPFPNKLNYSYQMIGIDSVWSNYNQESKLFLPYLPSGKFNINLKIRDLHFGQTSVHNLVNITIKPPFWKTWWFISTLLVLLGTLGYFTYRKRINFIKERERKEALTQKRTLEIKLEALQSQMNPHFTFNAMNSIQNFIIDNDIDNALMYMGEFAKLIRKTLNNSSKKLIILAEEISYLQTYISLEKMRFKNSIEVVLDYSNLDINHIEIPPMLIQPFVENTFVHAFTKEIENPMLEIKFSVNKELLIVEVKDNGKGIGKTLSGQLHESKGMKLVSERLSLMKNDSIKVLGNEFGGTSVILKFPLQKHS